ncbi:MAG TPA: hypothetical protein VL993_06290 [Stellaceae bacterium]|nr:hypothetical protein [Stellaceae bacterium]
MIIVVTEAGTVDLTERDDFKNFKIAVAKKDASAEFIAGALKGMATPEPDGKTAWVSAAALKQGQPADWIASFDKMVESVRRFGWVRDDGTVRAHIERA